MYIGLYNRMIGVLIWKYIRKIIYTLLPLVVLLWLISRSSIISRYDRQLDVNFKKDNTFNAESDTRRNKLSLHVVGHSHQPPPWNYNSTVKSSFSTEEFNNLFYQVDFENEEAISIEGVGAALLNVTVSTVCKLVHEMLTF